MIDVEPIKKERIRAKESRGVKIRYVTEITNDNISYCKELLKFAEVRHLNRIKGNFEVSDGSREYVASATLQEAEPLTQLIYSNVKEVVEQQQYVFDSFWIRAIPAQQRIKEIEEGIRQETIEIIHDPKEALEHELRLLKSAKHQIRMIFSTLNTFYIQQKQLGIIQLLKDSAQRGVNIKILTPIDKHIAKIITELKQQKEQKWQQYQRQNNNIIDIRDIPPTSGIKTKTIIVDKQDSLTMEIKDISNPSYPHQVIGLSTFSNSKPTILSYLSVFENLWNQSELNRQLKEARQRLEDNYAIQREFINVAAHELRTPVTPILGYAELLLEKEVDERKREALWIILRNSQRLVKLASDILDTARIESNTLKVDKKEAVNLNEVILDIMKYYRKRHHHQQQQKKKIMASSLNSNNNYQTKLLFKLIQQGEEGVQEDILVQADKERITQVISNILDNAYKFSEQGGEILITLEKKEKEKHNEKDNNNNHNNKKGRKSLEYQYSQERQEEEKQGEAVITIKDIGTGIDPEILPRLFSKFASKSDKGTGLGLYISKYIVEAHGGRMWAKNNSDGKGATFTFTLPLKQ